MESQHTNVSRRSFLKASGVGLTFSIALGAGAVAGFGNRENRPHETTARNSAFGAWVHIDTDGTVLIYNPAAEMGQGSMTALPVVVAEEMDADWARVRIEHAPIEPATYGLRGRMMTVGSWAVMGYFMILRRAGAQIRRVLLDNAASHWQVPVTELTTEPGLVVHTASGRRLTYGEIAAFADIPEQLPEIQDTDLKSPADFRLIGHSVPRRDVPSKTDGSAQFALDVQVPGLLYGMIERAPIHNDEPATYNKTAVEALPGITTTVTLDHGIGIIGESFDAVLRARQTLEVEWKGTALATSFDSVESLSSYASIPGSGQVQPRSISSTGDIARAMQQGARHYKADYLADHIYHAQMEPLNALVSVNTAGDGAEAWVGTQFTSGARAAIAETLGIPVERVTLHPCYLGGGYGRRSNSDYVIEATHLSNAVKKPVKLMWTREDDLQYGQYRPMCLQRMEAAIDADGDVSAWFHCVVGDGGGLLSSGIAIPFYNIPNQNIERCVVSHGVRLKHWRAVGHGFNKYAIEAFIDEIAAGESMDPYALRRTLMKDAPRALKVLDTVAEMADWGGAVPEGRARGMAFGERSGSLAAGVAEISVNRTTGVIRVHRFWCAVDGGIIVQPDNALAQLEGGIVHGLSSVLYERISVKNGRTEQSNFHDYRLMRMSEIPEMDIQFIPSYEAPTGMGETSLPVTGGAVANAFAALTGKRLRHMPFTPERVLEVLG